MKAFLDENFLLQTATAQRLYHAYAAPMPIIDYHNHLPPQQVAAGQRFENLTQAWLYGDHYKWRAMRANGIDEQYCTGNAGDLEKFEKWAETVPYTVRNPLYHWTHLELQRYFNIKELLTPSTARKIYDDATALLQTKEYSAVHLLQQQHVEVICTTDDPLDALEDHFNFQQQQSSFRMLPTFRPDKAMQAEDTPQLNGYIDKLEVVCNMTIGTYADYLQALKSRHDYFATAGCKLSDHGVEELYADDCTQAEASHIFSRIRNSQGLTATDIRKFKSALLQEFAKWNHEKNWVQQFHIGPLRNPNTRMQRLLGADTGWDSIGNPMNAATVARFLNRLDSEDQLAKTILYNIHPADNEMLAAITGSFNDGRVAGKIQFGAAWWFNDQQEGISRQLNALGNMGLLSRFVGMVTDSRSFLSFPRHEYFRRILCNIFGNDMENGLLPADEKWIGQVIQNICYHNAKSYFGF